MPHKAFPPYGTVDADDMTPVGRSGRVLYTLAEARSVPHGDDGTVLVDRFHPLYDAWPFVQGAVWCYVRCDPPADVDVKGALTLARTSIPATETTKALTAVTPPPRADSLIVCVSVATKLTFVLAVRFDLAP